MSETSVRLAGSGSAWHVRAGATAVVAIGAGTTIAFAAALATSIPLAIAGGSLLAAGLIVLLSAGWIDALGLVALSLPLPALYSSDTARVAPALLASSLVLVAWLLASAIDSRPIAWRAIPLRSVLFLFTAILVAAALAQDPLSAAREVINWLILLSFLLVASAELGKAPARVRTLALTIAKVAGVCGTLAFLETAGVLPARFIRSSSALNRAALGFGWPNELGMFMALSLPFSVYATNIASSARARWLAGAGLAATIVGLVATFSRGSWLAVLVAPLALLLTGERRFVLRIWVVAFLAALMLDFVLGGAIRERIASTIGDWVVEQRAALTLAGLLMYQAHPLTGVGPGGFAVSLQEYGPNITWLWDYLPTAQNGYVQMAAEAGTVGLIALLFFLGHALYTQLRGARAAGRQTPAAQRNTSDDLLLRRTLIWAFAVACVLALAEWTFAHGIGQLIMLIAAMGFALNQREAAL